eukprot:94508-Pyramimonas_sp.AAC.1
MRPLPDAHVMFTPSGARIRAFRVRSQSERASSSGEALNSPTKHQGTPKDLTIRAIVVSFLALVPTRPMGQSK